MSYTLFHNAHFGPGASAMLVSGGRIGLQITLAPEDLRRAAGAEFADVIHS